MERLPRYVNIVETQLKTSKPIMIQIDSARMYGGGKTEEILGDVMKDDIAHLRVATKANPWYGDLSRQGVRKQLEDSLKALKVENVDVFYLHGPDAKHDIRETLDEVQKMYKEKKFERFALSNFTAWETTWIHNYMSKNKWITPSVYQGMYNPITRTVETELFPALRRLGMDFYAYNPLAGGMLSGKHVRDNKESRRGGRFRDDTQWGKIYQERFMLDAHFDGMDIIKKACEKEKINPVNAALRWMKHHSKLSNDGDAIIIGASKIQYFTANVNALDEGKLPDSVVNAYDKAWEIIESAHAVPKFSRGYSGSSLKMEK
jgi:aflatoxin B1 aldehyde reductase